MKRSVRKKLDDSFELKKSSRPVNCMNSYSVFKNDRLVFMMDGDRVSVFKPDEVEVISAPEDAEVRLYLVGTWVFSGSCCLTLGLRRWLPSRAVPVGTVLFGTVLLALGASAVIGYRTIRTLELS